MQQSAGADPFGSDPFNAPKSPLAGRVESPTPALPPKKSKQPPPRPAPPKAGTKGPQRPAPPTSVASKSPQSDPFASQSDPFGGTGFADFASFDSKVNFNVQKMHSCKKQHATEIFSEYQIGSVLNC